MNKFKFAFLGYMLMASGSAWSMNWQSVNTLDNVRIDSVGHIYGNTINQINPSSCTVTGFKIDIAHPGHDAMLSLLLMSVAGQKDVVLSISDCPVDGSAIVDGVRVNN